MKKWLFFLVCFVLVLYDIMVDSVVFAKTELSLWSGYPEMIPFYEKIAKDYQGSHPDVEINILAYNLRDFEQKLAATIPTDTVADIVEIAAQVMRKFFESGFIPSNPPEIDAMLKGGSYSQIAIDNLTYGDHTFGIPLIRSREVMFCNRKMFDEAGITRAPENWDEVIDYAKKLARYDEQGNLVRSGISHRLSGAGMGVAEKWWYWLYLAGGDILKKYPDGKYRADYDNKAGRKTLKFYIDAVYKYHVDDFKVKHDAEAFALELTAMFMRESWVVGYMKENAPQVEYFTATLPSDKRAGVIEELINLHVTRTSKNSEIAWDFIKFMLQPENQKYLIETVGWIAARGDLDFSDIYEKTEQYRAFIEIPENFELFSWVPIDCQDEIMTRLAERLVDYFLDESLLDNPEGIARAIHEAAEETNDILREHEWYHKD